LILNKSHTYALRVKEGMKIETAEVLRTVFGSQSHEMCVNWIQFYRQEHFNFLVF